MAKKIELELTEFELHSCFWAVGNFADCDHRSAGTPDIETHKALVRVYAKIAELLIEAGQKK